MASEKRRRWSVLIDKWWVKSKPTIYRNEDVVERINKGVSLCVSKY